MKPSCSQAFDNNINSNDVVCCGLFLVCAFIADNVVVVVVWGDGGLFSA